MAHPWFKMNKKLKFDSENGLKCYDCSTHASLVCWDGSGVGLDGEDAPTAI